MSENRYVRCVMTFNRIHKNIFINLFKFRNRPSKIKQFTIKSLFMLITHPLPTYYSQFRGIKKKMCNCYAPLLKWYVHSTKCNIFCLFNLTQFSLNENFLSIGNMKSMQKRIFIKFMCTVSEFTRAELFVFMPVV